jgi:hypothetical protein
MCVPRVYPTIKIYNVCITLTSILYYVSGTTEEGPKDFLKMVDELFASFLCENT